MLPLNGQGGRAASRKPGVAGASRGLPNAAKYCYSGSNTLDLVMLRFAFFTAYFYFSHSSLKAVE